MASPIMASSSTSSSLTVSEYDQSGAHSRRENGLSALENLVRDAAALGAPLTAADAGRLLGLLDELAAWNQRMNLTGITDARTMITHHLLDSLAVHPDLAGERIADVGTGAGFPGLPLALVNRQRHFTLIDSTAKKLRFVEHVVRLLGLANVTAVHARAEKLALPAFDTIVARAFAPLPELVERVAGLSDGGTRVLAMKGKWPQQEIDALPRDWRVRDARTLSVPGLDAARCVLVLGRDIM
jgi:16S rRNA (guanine527-N7)-methyltransferase